MIRFLLFFKKKHCFGMYCGDSAFSGATSYHFYCKFLFGKIYILGGRFHQRYYPMHIEYLSKHRIENYVGFELGTDAISKIDYRFNTAFEVLS